MPLHIGYNCIMSIKSSEDREFMQTLYANHMRAMYLAAYRITRNASDAEDTVSAACLSLVENIDKLKQVHPKACSAYVLVTVRNQALTLMNHRNAERHMITELKASHLLPEAVPPPDEDPQLLRHRTLEEVLHAISLLTKSEQMVLQMHYFEQMPYADLAQLLGLNESHARTKVSRARRKLLRILKEAHDDE